MGFFSKFTDKIAQYADAQLNLIKLNIVQHVSRILSFLIFTFICLLCVLCMFIFVGISLGEYFTLLMGSKVLGYFFAALFFLLVFIILVFVRKKITDFFTNTFISSLTDQDDEDEQTENKN